MTANSKLTEEDKNFLQHHKRYDDDMLTLKTEYLKLLRKYEDKWLDRSFYSKAFHSTLSYVMPKPEEEEKCLKHQKT